MFPQITHHGGAQGVTGSCHHRQLDPDHALLLEDMGASKERELENRLGVLLAHLLKWRYQPEGGGSRIPAGGHPHQEKARLWAAVRGLDPRLLAITDDALDALKQRGWFQPAFLDRARQLHREAHAAYYGELVWILTLLELWLRANISYP